MGAPGFFRDYFFSQYTGNSVPVACGGARLATLREMGDRFVSAWKRAEAGKVFEERHVTFFTSEELTAAFTPKRRELLRRLHGKARKPVAMFKKRNAC